MTPDLSYLSRDGERAERKKKCEDNRWEYNFIECVGIGRARSDRDCALFPEKEKVAMVKCAPTLQPIGAGVPRPWEHVSV